jgi:hypothetical protein
LGAFFSILLGSRVFFKSRSKKDKNQNHITWCRLYISPRLPRGKNRIY